jgi:hypothetical protein
LRGGHRVGEVGARARASSSPDTPTPENAETNGKTTRSRAVDLAAAKAPSPPKYSFLEFFYGFVGDTSRVAGSFSLEFSVGSKRRRATRYVTSVEALCENLRLRVRRRVSQRHA